MTKASALHVRCGRRVNEPKVPWPAAQWQLPMSRVSSDSACSNGAARTSAIRPWLQDRPDVQPIHLGGVIRAPTIAIPTASSSIPLPADLASHLNVIRKLLRALTARSVSG
jgi:hypothetical protein